MTLVVKTDGNPLAIAESVRDAVRAIDRNLPVSDIRTMDAVAASALAQPRFVTFLLALFAGTALTLAAIGIYGTISLLVSERTQEMGIRLALGADGQTILKLVLGQGLVLTAIGVTVGLAGAVILTRTLSGLVYGVGTLDPVTFIAVPAMLCVIALLACFIPARRAAPSTRLRHFASRDTVHRTGGAAGQVPLPCLQHDACLFFFLIVSAAARRVLRWRLVAAGGAFAVAAGRHAVSGACARPADHYHHRYRHEPARDHDQRRAARHVHQQRHPPA